MIRFVLLIAAVAACASPVSAAPAENAEVKARVERIEHNIVPRIRVEGRAYPARTVQQLMRDHGVPALSIAVINDGRIEWTRTYGVADVASKRAADADTLFQAASISKPVAAMAALDLVESGALSLDEDVNRRLVGWKVPSNAFTAAQPVTLRHLLSHTGGLTVSGFPGYTGAMPVPTVRQILDGAPPANTKPVVVDQAPGTAWRYSGGGMTVAQLLLTDVTGRPFPELMRRHVLDPLGMRDSTYEQPLPQRLRGRAATGYTPDGSAVPGLYPTHPEMAAAGLWTTSADLARFVVAVQDAYAGRSEKVITRETAQAMVRPGLGAWGLGLEVRQEGEAANFSHSGSNQGYRAYMQGFLNRGQGLVVLTNSDTGMQAVFPLVHAIAVEYGWPGRQGQPIIIKHVRLEPAALGQFPGAYVGPENLKFIVTADAGTGTLTLVAPSGPPHELVPQGGDDFVDAAGGEKGRFVRGADGSIAALEIAGLKLQRAPAAP